MDNYNKYTSNELKKQITNIENNQPATLLNTNILNICRKILFQRWTIWLNVLKCFDN